MSVLKKIWSNKWMLRSIIPTIYFNLRCLPFKQAVKLPIWLYKPRFGDLSGTIKIDTDIIKPGMIRLGFHNVGLYANNGIYIQNSGTMIFKGTALIGNDCYMGVGKSGKIIFGDNFRATTTFRITSQCSIAFDYNVRFGWDCLVSDSDFHKLRKLDGTYTKGYAPIEIGHDCWIANGCRILKRTKLPAFTTVSAGTILNTPPKNVPEYSVIGQSREVKVLYTGLYLDPNNDDIIID